MRISTWRTDAGDLDILAEISDRQGRQLSYEELAARATVLDLDGIAVRVAALDDVIASKERADRPKDRAALEELRTLRQPGDGAAVERVRRCPHAEAFRGGDQVGSQHPKAQVLVGTSTIVVPVDVGGGIGSPASRMASRWNSIAERMRVSTCVRLFPVAMQPGSSGTYAEYESPSPSMITA